VIDTHFAIRFSFCLRVRGGLAPAFFLAVLFWP